MIHLIATLRIKEGALPAVLEAARPCIEATRREEGCLHYDLHQSLTEPEKLVFVEKWENRKALADHFREPHLIAFRKAAEPQFTSREIVTIEGGDVEVM